MYFSISFYLTDPLLQTPTVLGLGRIHRGPQHQHNHIIKLCIISQFVNTQKGLTLQALPSQQAQKGLLPSSDCVSPGQCLDLHWVLRSMALGERILICMLGGNVVLHHIHGDGKGVEHQSGWCQHSVLLYSVCSFVWVLFVKPPAGRLGSGRGCLDAHGPPCVAFHPVKSSGSTGST